MKYGFHDIESRVYGGVKAEGVKDYVGLVDLGSPSVYIMDPSLIKTVLVILQLN